MRTLLNKNNRDFLNIFLISMVLLPFSLTACGYRGPLYLPQEQAAEQAPDDSGQTETGYPASEETDNEEDNEGGGVSAL